MKLNKCEYVDEWGPIKYGLQFGHPARRPVWKVIDDGDDPATLATISAMPSFGGVNPRGKLTEALIEHLVRTAKDRKSDAWVGWRYVRAALADMPDAHPEDVIWMALIDAQVQHKLEEGKT